MKTIEEIRTENLKNLVKEFPTLQAFADAIDKPHSQVGQWIHRYTDARTGKPRTIGSRMCREVEIKLGKPTGWMDVDHGLGNVTEILEADFNRVPLISWLQATVWRTLVETFKPEDAIDWPPCPVPHSRSTFALKIQGMSMHNPAGRPSFSEGDIIFIDPDVSPQHKNLVLASVAGEKEAIFRQLVVEGGKQYLFALNPIWPERMLPVDETITIIGTAIVKQEALI